MCWLCNENFYTAHFDSLVVLWGVQITILEFKKMYSSYSCTALHLIEH